jgi:hypothetical protein
MNNVPPSGRKNSFRATPPSPSSLYLPPGLEIDPRDWGRPYLELENPLPHIEIAVICTPEGMRPFACCTVCGGRYETLLDVRPLSGKSTVADKHAMIVERLDAVMTTILDLWMTEHTECAQNPRRHHLPTEVMQQVERRLARATERLRAGRRVPAVLDLLLENGRVLEISIDDLPPRTPGPYEFERTIEVAIRHFAARECMREMGVEPRAAIVVGEAWETIPSGHEDFDRAAMRYPSVAPLRREIMFVSVATSSVCLAGSAQVHRQGDHRGRGRGSFTRPEISTPVRQSLLLDGLLAADAGW